MAGYKINLPFGAETKNGYLDTVVKSSYNIAVMEGIVNWGNVQS